MTVCATCGNDYDKTFEVIGAGGESKHFDSFECAIHAMAPRCPHCGVHIIGHGIEADGTVFCCAHCASQQGVEAVQDRA